MLHAPQRVLNTQMKGFTVVELLIVIVVIAVLASITVVAFNGVQQRGRDAKRASDGKSIVKALEAYRATHGRFPTPTPSRGGTSFEQSTDTPGTFMEYLQGEYMSTVPIDPINDSTRYYRYHVYEESTLPGMGCPTDKGRLMIFYVMRFEVSGAAPPGDSTLSCNVWSWSGSSATRYFYYSYEAGK